jgi:hypothetical protein
MPHALIMDFAGGTTEDYDAVVEKMQLNGRLPEHALAHISAPHAGGLRVCDVWESPDAFERFAQDQIGPLSAEQGMERPDIRMFETFRYERVSDERPGFAQVVLLPGIDAETFEEVDKKIRPDGNFPEGLIWHANGKLGDGWCVIDTWKDQGYRDRFRDAKIAPNMKDAPLSGPPTFEDLQVHGSLERSAEAASA